MNFFHKLHLPAWSVAPYHRGIKLYHVLRFGKKVLRDEKNNRFREYQKNRPLGIQPVICYAPFKSLFVGMEGRIYACCFNSTHILGEYPSQSLKQIWEGEKISALRTALENSDLSSGCQRCRSQIEEKAFSSVLAASFDHLPQKKYPSQIEFEMSNVCNMACVICTGSYSSLIRAGRENLPGLKNPYDDAFVPQLEEFIPHLKKAKFLGGEPFLINIYFKIWEKIISVNPGCVISVQTNASVLNDRIKEMIGRGKFHFTISIDAIRKETFDAIRMHGDHKTVMDNTMFFHEYCRKNKTYFGIAVCPIRQNWHEIPEIVEYCNKLNAPVTFNRVWHPSHCSLWNCSAAKLGEIHQLYSQYRFPVKTSVQHDNERQFAELTGQIYTWLLQAERAESAGFDSEKPDNHVLLSGLMEKVRKEYSSGSGEKADPMLIEQWMAKVDRVLQSFKGHEHYSDLLLRLHELPAETLAAMIKDASEESLINRAKEWIVRI